MKKELVRIIIVIAEIMLLIIQIRLRLPIIFLPIILLTIVQLLLGRKEEDYWNTTVSCALRKQIPQKILRRDAGYGTPWLCPECEADQIKVEFFATDGKEPEEKKSYCWNCGQAIKWDE